MSHAKQLKAARSTLCFSVLLGAVALLSGCSDDPVLVQGPEHSVASRVSVRAAPRIQEGPIGSDQVFHDIGGRIRGFAGFYFDEDGAVNVMLVDHAQNGLARREVSDLLGRTHGRALGHMKFKRVKYDFRQLYHWKQAIVGAEPDAGLTTLGICEEQNRLCIGVYQGGGLAAARALVTRLGIPADAVSIQESDPVQARKLLTDLFSPVPGGVLISAGCTLGFNALFGGVRVFLTAAHCTHEFGSADPANVFGQPDHLTREIGLESYDPPTTTCTYNSRTYACRFSDAAEFMYFDTVAFRLGRIARPYFNTITVDPNNPEFRIVGERPFPYVGETVTFVGRASGWREGPVNQTCMDVTTNYTANGLPVRLYCQDRFGVGNLGGDSGAPVFHRIAYPSDVNLGGILFGGDGAGNSYYSSMRQIEHSDNFGDYQTISP